MTDANALADAEQALAERDAEIARMREALNFYASSCDAPSNGPCPYQGNLCCMTARAALGEKP